MEEKERYEKIYFDNETRFKIIDNITEQNVGGIDSMIKILNQQDKELSKLRANYQQVKEENDQFKQELDKYKETVQELQKSNSKMMDKLLDNYLSRFQTKDLDELSNTIAYNAIKENQQLKQQLAEKDKELSEYVKIVDDLHKQLSDKCDFCDKTKDQDKISFAVEQLKKVKNYMITDEKDMFGANYLMNSVYVLEFIDNQIKQLKEGK